MMVRSISKMLTCFVLSLTAVSVSAPIFATTGTVSGTVQYIRTHNAAAEPGWGPPIFWFTLTGVTSAGACSFGATPSPVFIGNDTQMFSLLATAQAAGTPVALAFDDTKLINGICIAEYITVGSPAAPF